MAKWTREQIIREILRRETANLPLNLKHGGQGVDSKLYQAGARVFGGWRNALLAAGISPDKAFGRDQWPPTRIVSAIKSLARGRRPLSLVEVDRRYPQLVDAARRRFGSWPKAVIAAGVDPGKLRRALPWTRDRIVQAILARALRDERLGSHSVQPRSLAEAGARVFGSWQAAIAAAGLDPGLYMGHPGRPRARAPAVNPAGWVSGRRRAGTPERANAASRVASRCTCETVTEAIWVRLNTGQPVNSACVKREDRGLYRAGERLFGNWRRALEAAHLNPDELCPTKQRRRGGLNGGVTPKPCDTAHETGSKAASDVAPGT